MRNRTTTRDNDYSRDENRKDKTYNNKYISSNNNFSSRDTIDSISAFIQILFILTVGSLKLHFIQVAHGYFRRVRAIPNV